MVSPCLTSLSCFIPTLLLGASGHLISCSWRYRGLSGSSEGIEPFLSLLPNYGTIYLCTLDRPLHCPFLKPVLKPIFIPWLLTQHETLLLFLLFLLFHFICFMFLWLFMYSTLFQLWLFLKCSINKVELSTILFCIITNLMLVNSPLMLWMEDM